MTKISTIKERILQFIEIKKITKEEFYKNTEISPSNFKGSNLKSEIGGDKLVKISTIYPELNADWLITGKGEILKTKNEKNVTKENGNKNGNNFGNKRNIEEMLPNMGVPLIPIDAMAGFGTGAVQVMDYDTQTYIVPEFTELNVDFMIRVKGSSMYPKYNSGDLVACKKLSMRDIFFQWNKVYVLDTEQGAIIKRIKKGEDQEHILLISENVNYDPFELHISKIFAIALVVGVIRLE